MTKQLAFADYNKNPRAIPARGTVLFVFFPGFSVPPAEIIPVFRRSLPEIFAETPCENMYRGIAEHLADFCYRPAVFNEFLRVLHPVMTVIRAERKAAHVAE